MGVVQWGALVVLLCAAAAVIALPLPAPAWPPGEARVDERLRVAGNRAYAVQVELRYAVTRYYAQRALARWRALSPDQRATPFVVDESVPRADRQRVEDGARAQWALAGRADTSPGTRSRATMFVMVDTTSINVSSAKRPLHGNESHYFALPANGGPCVTMVRLRLANESAIRGITLGPCAFYARYGLPGHGMRSWLETTAGTMALRSDVARARAMETRQLSIRSFDHRAGACLVRGGRYCLEAIGLRADSREPDTGTAGPIAAPLPGLIGSGPAARPFSLGERSRWFLSDMAADIGEERFLAFWQSPEAPEVAFRKTTGMPLEDWTQRWLQRGAEPFVREAGVSLPNVAWLALAVPFLLAIAVRPRDRVLARPTGAR
jgi:hypothetical protein